MTAVLEWKERLKQAAPGLLGIEAVVVVVVIMLVVMPVPVQLGLLQ